MTGLSENDPAERQKRWGRQHDLKPKSQRACPAVVGLDKCRASYKTEYEIAGEHLHCICEHSPFQAVRDHARLWVGPAEFVLTTEPYNLSAEDEAAFRSLMGERHLEVRRSRYSPWNPGETTMLVVTQPDSDLDLNQ